MSQPYRVLLVTKSTAGVAEYVRQLVQGMDRSRFSFTVVCLSEGGAEFAAELSKISGVQALSMEMNRYRIDPLSDARVFIHLAKYIRAGDFDLIHAHASKPGYLTRAAAVGTGIPVLYSPHSFSFHQGMNRAKAWFYALLERLAIPFTRFIIAVSNGERELARQYRVGPDSLFIVVHTGIDPKPFSLPVDVSQYKEMLGIPTAAPVVGAVGRLNNQKSPLDFVRMAGIVHQRRPEVHFVWIGAGPLESDARILSQGLGLDSVFHFLGQRQDVPSILRVLNCFVLPSRWEGFSLVILEALASGTPVVATDISGTREAIEHGRNGWLAPVGDCDALAGYVVDILENPDKASAFRAAGRKRIEEEFTTSRMFAALESVYLDAITASK